MNPPVSGESIVVGIVAIGLANRASLSRLAGLTGLATWQSVFGNADHSGSDRILAGTVVGAVNHHRASEYPGFPAGELDASHGSFDTDIAMVVSYHRP